MKVTPTDLPEVLVIEPRRHRDGRGFFCESWSRRAFEAAGLRIDFVQDNHSFSAPIGVVRGLHFQAPPMAQTKLISAPMGRIRDIVVDIRVGSPRYGRSVAVELSAESARQLLVPEGFLHGFATLAPNTHVFYKTSAPYSAEHEGAVLWRDEALALDWAVAPQDAAVSPKDGAAPSFAEFESPFRYRV